MADIVLGIGTSHSPVLSLPVDLWPAYAEGDKRNPELLKPPHGEHLTYEQLLAQADPAIGKQITPEYFKAQYDACQRGIEALTQTLREVKPDTIVMISDDQDEIFFDDNYPAISIYWGETLRNIPRQPRGAASDAAMWGYAKEDREYPADSALGLHLIESLMEQDFDIAHSRYLHEQYGGTIGPAGYVNRTRTTPTRPQGMIHGFGFVVSRLLDGMTVPMVPVTLNTCYPPNQPSPRRCYQLGQAIRRAIEAWDSPKRVAVLASGGLSHFVVDEELDRMVLDAFARKDGELLSSLPKERLNSATSETRNWIAAAGACEHLDFELFEYVANRRTPAGTGGGWAFGRWTT